MGENTTTTPAPIQSKKTSYIWIAVGILFLVQLGLLGYFFGRKYITPATPQTSNTPTPTPAIGLNTPIIRAPEPLTDYASRQLHEDLVLPNGLILRFTNVYLAPAQELPDETITSGLQGLVINYDVTNTTATQAAATLPTEGFDFYIANANGTKINENNPLATFRTRVTSPVAGLKTNYASVVFHIPGSYKETKELILVITSPSLTPKKLYIRL